MMLSPTSSPRAIRSAAQAAARDSPRGTPDLQRRALLGSTMIGQDIEADKIRVIGELASRMKQPVAPFDKNKRGECLYCFLGQVSIKYFTMTLLKRCFYD